MRYSFKDKDRSLPLYLDSIGYDWQQEAVKRPQGYPYVHWLQTYSGRGIVEIENQTLTLNPGQGILINQGIPHNYYGENSAENGTWRTGYFTFGGASVGEITTTLGFHDYLYLSQPDAKIRDFIKNHYDQIENKDPFHIYGSSEMVYSFLLLLKKYMLDNPRNQQSYQKIIAPILDLIRDHYVEDLDNTDFQRVTHYSTQYILETFRTYYGNTPHQILIDLRIRKAKELLLNQPTLSVEEIGRMVGFNTYSYFIMMFKRAERVTPGKFRHFYF